MMKRRKHTGSLHALISLGLLFSLMTVTLQAYGHSHEDHRIHDDCPQILYLLQKNGTEIQVFPAPQPAPENTLLPVSSAENSRVTAIHYGSNFPHAPPLS